MLYDKVQFWHFIWQEKSYKNMEQNKGGETSQVYLYCTF